MKITAFLQAACLLGVLSQIPVETRAESSPALLLLDFRKEMIFETSGEFQLPINPFRSGATEPEFLSGDTGSVVFAPATQRGGGLRIEGSEDLATLGGPDDAISVVAWVKPSPPSEAGAGDKQTILGNLSASERAGWLFGLLPGGRLLFFWSRSDADATLRHTESVVSNDQWHHVAVTWNNAQRDGVQFYVDGIPTDARAGDRAVRSKGTGVIPVDDTPLIVGAIVNGRFPLSGEIRELRVYNRFLEADEIGELAAEIQP